MAQPVTISFDDAVIDTLNAQLEYGDNRSEIVNEAVREHLGMEVEA